MILRNRLSLALLFISPALWAATSGTLPGGVTVPNSVPLSTEYGAGDGVSGPLASCSGQYHRGVRVCGRTSFHDMLVNRSPTWFVSSTQGGSTSGTIEARCVCSGTDIDYTVCDPRCLPQGARGSTRVSPGTTFRCTDNNWTLMPTAQAQQIGLQNNIGQQPLCGFSYYSCLSTPAYTNPCKIYMDSMGRRSCVMTPSAFVMQNCTAPPSQGTQTVQGATWSDIGAHCRCNTAAFYGPQLACQIAEYDGNPGSLVTSQSMGGYCDSSCDVTSFPSSIGTQPLPYGAAISCLPPTTSGVAGAF